MSLDTGATPVAAGLKPRFQEFLASGNFTPSAALIAAGGVIEIDLRGGGGSGGGAIPTVPGGGGGESRTKTKLVLTNVAPIAVTLGVGGMPGAPGAFAGGDGTASSFGALLTVPGGKGGTPYFVGGDGSGRDGRCGQNGQLYPAATNAGGDGGGDGGGKGFNYPNAPSPGEYGCGGGGAGYTLTTAAGAAGGGGYALITWWE